jgi:hypothetical protein
MRWITIFLLLTTAAEAQGPPPTPAHTEKRRDVSAKLQSTDPVTRAWGAYEAGAFHVRDSIPALEGILSGALPAQTDREGWALVDLALDSLIQLKADVPASLASRYAHLRPVQAHILLSSATNRVPTLLGLLKEAKGLDWYVTANLLLRDKAPGLASHLLQNVRLQLIVSVSEDGNTSSISGGGLGGGVGDGIGQNLKGFPPHPSYRFEMAMSPGFIVLADGPRPVFYSRIVHTEFQYGVSTLYNGGPDDEDRLKYLQAMVDPFAEPTLRARTHEVASWTTPAALLERIAKLREDRERRFNYLRSHLEARYKLPQASSRVPIEIQINDLRKDRSVPLPAIPR